MPTVEAIRSIANFKVRPVGLDAAVSNLRQHA